jgi:SecD/SecF fusion protein
MKANYTRIVICLLPVLLGIAVVAWAVNQYAHGRGGFRLGVDLVGGTILVYEVDYSKMTEDQRRDFQRDFKAEDLAASLKRRIDPADLYNVTIRPVAGDPPRVEIVLPTGGARQVEAERDAWRQLIEDATREYPVEGNPNPYGGVHQGQVAALTNEISKTHPDTDVGQISNFIGQRWQFGKDKRQLTGEGIEEIKILIAQQGRLEFRILANRVDDREAIDVAQKELSDVPHRIAQLEAEREALRAKKDQASFDRLAEVNRELDGLKGITGTPPPPPRPPESSPILAGKYHVFPVTLQNETTYHFYDWVEVGKEELYSLKLNSAAVAKNPAIKAQVDAAINKSAFSLREYPNLLFYVRTIPNRDRVAPRDWDQGKRIEWFVLTRGPQLEVVRSGGQEKLVPREITGDYLSSVVPGRSGRGNKLAVHFRLRSEGASLFGEVTNLNKPTGGFYRHLAIVLDGQVRSAPVLQSAIPGGSGEISGDYTQQDLNTLVTILRAGALPATLRPMPVSQNTTSSTLGEDTIRQGTQAVGYAFLAVLVFMVIYYRFAGGVACVALLANLLLTVAFMVLVKATFTLAGLAGLVLTLGMAVDANVLIYERLREERERGASLALALRNGYDRAFPTIIDTHLSSIFTAIVLYVVGNDQLKGFGISLTVGLIISLFTSLYVTRTIFDFWQAKGWLRDLNFMHIFRRVPHIDFMAIRYYWFTATVVLTVLGAALFVYRLPDDLNIDFVGGTAYTGQLTRSMTIAELRDRLEKGSTLPDLSPNIEGSDGRRFTVRTTERDPIKVQQDINDRLGPDLKKIYLTKYQIAPDGKSATVEFSASSTGGEADYASPAQLKTLLTQEFKKYDVKESGFRVERPEEKSKEDPQGQGHYSELVVQLNDALDRAKFEQVLKDTQEQFARFPQPERLENFDRQLAANTQERAMYAILASWAALLLYLWFRFGSWTFGAAAVLCLIHDLFFTLGMIAVCHYLHGTFIGRILGLGDFKIDLNSVAALLTLVGYSVSDTIVVFDRIREVRGKNPLLTPQMINDSVNQTLSRTILSALTVWLVVFVLYVAGGEGVHLFAFVMVVGVIVGTYSSIYIASPLLLMFGEGAPPRSAARAPQPVAAGGPQITVPSGTTEPRGITTMPSRMT